MSMFKNVKVYLGLGPDEEYEDRYLDDGYPEDDFDEPTRDDASTTEVGAPRRIQQTPSAVSQPRPVASPARSDQPSAVGAVRPLRPVPAGPDLDDDDVVADDIVVRKLDDAPEPTVRPRAIQQTKPKTVSPQSFGDAKILADEFKRSVPVVMNIRDLDRDLSRRLIDFASGVCYALGGAMEKLASGVFLLTPRGVEVTGDDRRRLEERGYD